MAKTTISCRLSEIDTLIKEYNKYCNDFYIKCQRFVTELGEIGISVAKANLGTLDELGNVSQYVLFSCLVEPATTDGAEAIMFGKDIATIKQAWISKDKNGQEYVKTAEVSPLLMYEFGSGWKSEVLFSTIKDVGQGTFPNQTHAFDPNGWYWKGIDGVWHHNGKGDGFMGITPTHPMYKAYLAMHKNIKRTAKKVFS